MQGAKGYIKRSPKCDPRDEDKFPGVCCLCQSRRNSMLKDLGVKDNRSTRRATAHSLRLEGIWWQELRWGSVVSLRFQNDSVLYSKGRASQNILYPGGKACILEGLAGIR